MFNHFNLKQLGVVAGIVIIIFLIAPLVGHGRKEGEVKAVIFNCDGILVDNDHLRFLAWQKALGAHKIPLLLGDYIRLSQLSPDKILAELERIKNQSLPQKILMHQSLIYQQLLAYQTPKIQPAITLAKEMKKNQQHLGIKLILISKDNKAETQINLDQAGLADIFDMIITQDDLQVDAALLTRSDVGTIPEKSSTMTLPEWSAHAYTYLLEQLKLPAKHCLLFESRAIGVDFARGLGMTVIAVPTPFTREQNFSQASEILNNSLYFEFEPYFNKSITNESS